MNPADMEDDGLKSGDTVTLVTEADDGVERSLSELQVVPYDIPRKSACGLLPGMQWADPALALCRRQQGAGGEIRSGAPVQGCYSGDHRRRRDSDLDGLSLAAEPVPFVSSIGPELAVGSTCE